jgi:glycopeptide antibiotics resistance protein
MDKKSQEDMWGTLGKWIFILALLVVLLIVLFIFRDQIYKGIQKIGDMLSFGGD